MNDVVEVRRPSIFFRLSPKCNFFKKELVEINSAESRNYLYNWEYNIINRRISKEKNPMRDCRIMIDFEDFVSGINIDMYNASFLLRNDKQTYDQIQSCELVLHSGPYPFRTEYNYREHYTQEHRELTFLKTLKQVDLVIKFNDSEYDLTDIDLSLLFGDMCISSIELDVTRDDTRVCRALMKWLKKVKNPCAVERKSCGTGFFDKFLSTSDNITSLKYDLSMHELESYGKKIHKKSRVKILYTAESDVDDDNNMIKWKALMKKISTSVKIRELIVYNMDKQEVWKKMIKAICNHKYLERIHIKTHKQEEVDAMLRYIIKSNFKLPKLKILTFVIEKDLTNQNPTDTVEVFNDLMHQIYVKNPRIFFVKIYSNNDHFTRGMNNISNIKRRCVARINEKNTLLVWLNVSGVSIPHAVIDDFMSFMKKMPSEFSTYLQ